MSWTGFVSTGAIFAGLAVVFGAFGAHGLKGKLTPEYLDIFNTGAHYHLIHAVALVLCGLLASRLDSPLLRYAGYGFIAGILLFSGSLYALTITGIRSLGMVTPFGGLAFIIGWGCMAAAFLSATSA